MADDDIPLQEFRTLQSIIVHHEGLAFRIKGWYVAAIGALLFASFHENLGLTTAKSLIIWVLVTLVFAFWILFHRDVVSRAIARSRAVEQELRKSADLRSYDGPRIGEALSYDDMTIAQRQRARLSLLGMGKGPHGRRRGPDDQVLLPIIAASILGAIIAFLVPGKNAGGGGTVAPETPPQPPVEAFHATSVPPGTDLAGYLNWGTLSILAGLVVLLFGFWLIFRRQGKAAKIIGAASLLAGAGLQVVGIQNLKIDKFIVIEKPSLKASISAAIKGELSGEINARISDEVKRVIAENPPPRPISIRATLADHVTLRAGNTPATPPERPPFLGARWLGSIEGFEIGQVQLPANSLPDGICDRTHHHDGPNALLVIVGGTDRLPLDGPIQARYETNTGLGLARAAVVREHLVNDGCWVRGQHDERILLLAAGPRTTPETPGDRAGVPTDRRVDIYVLGGAPAAADRTPAVDRPSPGQDVIVPNNIPGSAKVKAGNVR